MHSAKIKAKPGFLFFIFQCILAGLILLSRIAIIVVNSSTIRFFSWLIFLLGLPVAIIAWLLGIILLIRALLQRKNLLYPIIANLLLPFTVFVGLPLLGFAETNYVPHEREWLAIVDEVHRGERENHGYEPYNYRARGKAGHEDVYFSLERGAGLGATDDYRGFVYSKDALCDVRMTEATLIEWKHVRENWYYAHFRYS